MAKYLIRVAYTPEAWAAMVNEPQNRYELVKPAVESLGGKFEAAWFAFGEDDLVGIIDMPGNVDAAAFAVGVAAKGAVKKLTTTPLLTIEEGVEVMRRAQKVAYRPPTQAPAAVR